MTAFDLYSLYDVQTPSGRRLMTSFYVNLTERLEELEEGLTGGDSEKVANVLHKLTNAESFGFPRITELARLIEVAYPRRDEQVIESCVKELIDEKDSLSLVLSAH